MVYRVEKQREASDLDTSNDIEVPCVGTSDGIAPNVIFNSNFTSFFMDSLTQLHIERDNSQHRLKYGHCF